MNYQDGLKDGINEALKIIESFSKREVKNRLISGYATGYAGCLKDLSEMLLASQQTQASSES